MTKSETELLLRYIIAMYPHEKWNDQKYRDTLNIWSSEFSDVPRELVAKAFNAAKEESPTWMPTVGEVRSALRLIMPHEKSEDQEFRDRHCGKSKEEFEQMTTWEKSSAGQQAISSYKERLAEIIRR